MRELEESGEFEAGVACTEDTQRWILPHAAKYLQAALPPGAGRRAGVSAGESQRRTRWSIASRAARSSCSPTPADASRAAKLTMSAMEDSIPFPRGMYVTLYLG